MAWLIVTTDLELPFYQIGMLSGDGLAANDRSRRAQVAGVYQNGGRTLLPEERPSRIDLTDTSDLGKVPPLFASMDGILVASPDCHAVLTGLAPESLQSWPLMLSHNNHPLEQHPWYAINVHRRIESIDRDRSAIKQSKGFDGIVRLSLRLQRRQVALLEGIDESVHVWRDETFARVVPDLRCDEKATRIAGCVGRVDMLSNLWLHEFKLILDDYPPALRLQRRRLQRCQ